MNNNPGRRERKVDYATDFFRNLSRFCSNTTTDTEVGNYEVNLRVAVSIIWEQVTTTG